MMKYVGSIARRLQKSESGFTLIEMLIVVGIIVALAAAIVPQVVQFGDRGAKGANAAEKASLQTAIDGMLADKGLSTVATIPTQSKKAWNVNQFGTGGAALNTSVAGQTSYLSVTSTANFYCWDDKGKLTKQLLTSAANDCA